MQKLNVKKMIDGEIISIFPHQLVLISEKEAKTKHPLLVDDVQAQDFSVYSAYQQVAAIKLEGQYVPVLLDLNQVVELSEPARLAEILPFMLSQMSRHWWGAKSGDYIESILTINVDGETSLETDLLLSYPEPNRAYNFQASAIIHLRTEAGWENEVQIEFNEDGTVNADAMTFNEGITRTMFDKHIAKNESFVTGMVMFWEIVKLAQS